MFKFYYLNEFTIVLLNSRDINGYPFSFFVRYVIFIENLLYFCTDCNSISNNCYSKINHHPIILITYYMGKYKITPKDLCLKTVLKSKSLIRYYFNVRCKDCLKIPSEYKLKFYDNFGNKSLDN